MKKITKSEIREKRVLEYIKEEIKKKGYPPTVREICDALNVKSTSTIHKDIANLIEKGILKKDPSKPRALTLVGEHQTDLAVTDNSNLLSATSRNRINSSDSEFIEDLHEDIVDVPVIGQIAAGSPILAQENFEDSIPVPARFVRGENYILRVRGESMINVGIMDGDLILVKKAETAYNGEIVVAMIDGFESEATVKTFYREDGHFRLQPENDSMSPIIVKDMKILGIVTGVMRFFS